MTFYSVYQSLHKKYGPQHWWPGDSTFEIMVGAVLTQNTAWSNVEKAIANLKAADLLDEHKMALLPASELANLIRPAGYFNVKAKRLLNLVNWYLDQGGKAALTQQDDATLREGLLSVNGVGPETADDIVLYAFNRPVFVIDAYTRRIFSRLGLVDGEEPYEQLRSAFEKGLSKRLKVREEQVKVFNEYHALIVRHAKQACSKKPCCDVCCLQPQCPAVGV